MIGSLRTEHQCDAHLRQTVQLINRHRFLIGVDVAVADRYHNGREPFFVEFISVAAAACHRAPGIQPGRADRRFGATDNGIARRKPEPRSPANRLGFDAAPEGIGGLTAVSVDASNHDRTGARRPCL